MAQRPNILLIVTDQHRLSAVGAYGDTPCRTPNIDRLAREGVLFRNTYTVCPVCGPARATLMTGVYPHTHGICANIHEIGCSVHGLEDRPTLLPRRLQQAGYSTGYTGKWHLGDEQPTAFQSANKPSLPSSIGFEGQDFPGHGGAGEEYPQYRDWLARRGSRFAVKPWNEATTNIRAAELDMPTAATVPAYLAENTINLVNAFAQRNRPFFIALNFWGPHEPYHATSEFVDLYREVPIPPWPNFAWDSRGIPGPHQAKIHWNQKHLRWEDWEMAIRYYYARTTMIDAQIGRLYTFLEQAGYLEKTLIIFTADHGETLGSHGGLLDKGWHHFEETHRIPLILRFPQQRFAGEEREELISSADLYPTILEYAGASWGRADVHGRSMLPLIRRAPLEWRDAVVTEFLGLGNIGTCQKTLRAGRLKYGYTFPATAELYDLSSDPHEMENLIDKPGYAGEINHMQQKLRNWMVETRDPALRMYDWQLGNPID
jgi:arylsulfatase A-like enzyme